MLMVGKIVADQIQEELKKKISSGNNKISPKLSVILVGNHLPSHTYVTVKKNACYEVGIDSTVFTLPESVSEHEILQKIEELNEDNHVHGILIQLPLPSHINQEKIMERIDPKKDVDGFHPMNMGKLLLGISGGFVPCTPLGVKTLLDYYKIETAKKHVVIVGRSNIVGKPLAALLMQKTAHCNATVTIAHSQTRNLSDLTLTADILVACLGIPRFIKKDMIKEGVVIVDVGINREEDKTSSKGYNIVGDVDFKNVENKCLAITPVPKGIGPMTVAMLLHNTFQSFQRSLL